MNDHDVILAIHALLDGTAWDADTLDEIAKILDDNGYRVRDLAE